MVSKDLGFIGLGKMGAPMAGRLLDAGYALTVFDTREAALTPFVARGAKRRRLPGCGRVSCRDGAGQPADSRRGETGRPGR